MDEAIKVTEEKLRTLKSVVDKRKMKATLSSKSRELLRSLLSMSRKLAL